jgi:hypothetical protein
VDSAVDVGRGIVVDGAIVVVATVVGKVAAREADSAALDVTTELDALLVADVVVHAAAIATTVTTTKNCLMSEGGDQTCPGHPDTS